jgi:hypothetical protein
MRAWRLAPRTLPTRPFPSSSLVSLVRTAESNHLHRCCSEYVPVNYAFRFSGPVIALTARYVWHAIGAVLAQDPANLLLKPELAPLPNQLTR